MQGSRLPLAPGASTPIGPMTSDVLAQQAQQPLKNIYSVAQPNYQQNSAPVYPHQFQSSSGHFPMGVPHQAVHVATNVPMNKGASTAGMLQQGAKGLEVLMAAQFTNFGAAPARAPHRPSHAPRPHMAGSPAGTQPGAFPPFFAPSTAPFPPWVADHARLPREYHELLKSCMPPGFPAGCPETGAVYRLLSASGLPREVLGHIWSLTNRTMPGQLTTPEFFVTIALVAVAQRSSVPILPSIEALYQLKDPPIPSFAFASGAIASAHPTPSTAPRALPVASKPPRPSSGSNSSDFEPFQSAPPPASVEQAHPSAASLLEGLTLAPPLTPTSATTGTDEFGSFHEASVPIQPPRGTSTPLQPTRLHLSASVNEQTSADDLLGTLSSTIDSSISAATVDFSAPMDILQPMSMAPLRPTPIGTDSSFVAPSIVQRVVSPTPPASTTGSRPDSPASVRSLQHEPSLRSLELKTAAATQDKYAAVREITHSPDGEADFDRHLRVWTRCLESCETLLAQAVEVLGAASSSAVCREFAATERGVLFIRSIGEVYRVAARIRISLKTTAFQTEKIVALIGDIESAWENLVALLDFSKLLPDDAALDFRSAFVGASGDGVDAPRVCGVCLLSTDASSRSAAFADVDRLRLEYGGKHYHSQCANLWVNCVDSVLPALAVPS